MSKSSYIGFNAQEFIELYVVLNERFKVLTRIRGDVESKDYLSEELLAEIELVACMIDRIEDFLDRRLKK